MSCCLQPKDLQTFFRDNGIELTDAETKSLYVVFDTDGNKRMDRSEFMRFAEAAQTATLKPVVKVLGRTLRQEKEKGPRK